MPTVPLNIWIWSIVAGGKKEEKTENEKLGDHLLARRKKSPFSLFTY
jgi:hypothetical protein